MGSQDFLWLAIGLAALAAAAGIAFACFRLGALFTRVQTTLDKIDAQLDGVQAPLAKTLVHVSGVAESIDDIAGKVDRVTAAAEKAADAVARTADAAQAAVSPTIANLVGVVAGVSQGAKAFFRSRGHNGSREDG